MGHPGFWWISLKARDHCEDLGVDVSMLCYL